MLSTGLNATRNALKPVSQPLYQFQDVPKARRDLSGSSLQYVDNREHFQLSMGEMLLLCKEATRRQRMNRTTQSGNPGSSAQTTSESTEQSNDGGDSASTNETSDSCGPQRTNDENATPRPPSMTTKPLSLEYIADRLDVDDPCFGFVVRTNGVESSAAPPEQQTSDSCSWKKGMLQGFVTVTTFTTWQKTLRWDSLNPAAYEYDTPTELFQRSSGLRKWDSTNELANEIQSTVRSGNIYKEGIVWPHIAEISLLGALGCGRMLVELVIEHLEGLKATDKSNYDFVVLQATENSIPFYETLGFVRVGVVMKEDNVNDDDDDGQDDNNSEQWTRCGVQPVAKPLDDDPEEKAEALPYGMIMSRTKVVAVKKAGEVLSDLAKRMKLDVWDLIFLNKHAYPDISPYSRLWGGTVIRIPDVGSDRSSELEERSDATKAESSSPQWYFAKENETPRLIARKFSLNCLELVEANRSRLPELISSSRLRKGTRIKVSDFDSMDHEFKAYSHWSFPGDDFEEGEPSYMMVRKLHRRRVKTSKENETPVRSSLAIPLSSYEPTELLGRSCLSSSPPPPNASTPAASSATTPRAALSSMTKKRKELKPVLQAAPPKPPKRPLGSFFVFVAEQRQKRRNELEGLHAIEKTRLYSDLWRSLSDESRQVYEVTAEQEKANYALLKKEYERKLIEYRNAMASDETAVEDDEEAVAEDHSPTPAATNHVEVDQSLYNTVVRLRPGAMTEGSEYTYWYVLTFIPDLQWCHLVPMVQVGVFGADKPKSVGRPKYKLVDESLGKEVDISSRYCIPINSRSMRRTADADKEEWDVIDDGKPRVRDSGGGVASNHGRRNGRSSSRPTRNCRSSTSRRLSMGTGSQCDGDTSKEELLLEAIHPATKKTLQVRVKFSLVSDEMDPSMKRKRGRPKGSKNRPKTAPEGAGSSSNISSSDARSGGRSSTTPRQSTSSSLSSLSPEKRRPGRRRKDDSRSDSDLSTEKNLELKPSQTARPSRDSPVRGRLTRSGNAAKSSAVDDSPNSQKSGGHHATSPIGAGSDDDWRKSPSRSRPYRSSAPTFLGESHACGVGSGDEGEVTSSTAVQDEENDPDRAALMIGEKSSPSRSLSPTGGLGSRPKRKAAPTVFLSGDDSSPLPKRGRCSAGSGGGEAVATGRSRRFPRRSFLQS